MKDFVSRFFTMFPFYNPWNYQSKLWFSDVFREYKMGTLGRNKLFNSFQPSVPLLYPCKRQKNLSLVLFPGGIKLEHWEEMAEIISYCMLIFTKVKNRFSQEQFSITAFRFLNGLQKKPFYIGYPVFINRPILAFTLIPCKLRGLKWS